MSSSAPTLEHKAVSKPWASARTAFWVALAVRLVYMTLAHMYRQRIADDHFGYGWEMGRIARALVTGHGYSDPFRGHTGPTAWVAPLYPLIIAGVFKLFGVYTLTSAWVLLAINCVFNSLIVITIWEIAARCLNRNIAQWSMWIWALYPAAMQYCVKWIWEMSLTALLFSCVLVLALRMRGIGDFTPLPSASPKRWAAFGFLWGLIALSNPALLLFLPAAAIWILAGTRDAPRQLAGVSLAAAIFLLSISGWTYRNYRAFHQFVPMRGNFGAELYLGNGPGAVGLLMEYDHPFQSPVQLKLYRDMGEIAYSKMRGAKTIALIKADPKRFARLCLNRAYFFWFSVPHPLDEGAIGEYGRTINFVFISVAGLLGLALALRRRIPGAWLFFWAFLLLPLTYYFVSVHARFRHPLEPLITILGVYLFQSASKRTAFSSRLAR